MGIMILIIQNQSVLLIFSVSLVEIFIQNMFICLQTKEQTSDLWFDSRKVRIPASVANKVPKTSKANPQNFVTNHLHPRFKANNATQHGKI